MRAITALCFDLDETLLDGSGFSRTIKETCYSLCRRLPDLDPDSLLSANRVVFSNLGEAMIEDWKLGRVSGRELSHEIWH